MQADKMRLKEYLLLAACAAAIYLWLMVDQVFLPYTSLRFAALLIVSVGVLTGYFFILKPAEPLELAKQLSTVLGILAGAIVILQHGVIRSDISHKALLIVWVVVLVPYVAAGIYRLLKRTPGANIQ